MFTSFIYSKAGNQKQKIFLEELQSEFINSFFQLSFYCAHSVCLGPQQTFRHNGEKTRVVSLSSFKF